ncbi:MAG: M6 family metalloprotease domain-containing protein [Candidatus Marinimicrobia bacterium]|nr:M6 family metalloprotease domain-containing protein [Candidatus Neomarinimicrobiota bacterium]
MRKFILINLISISTLLASAPAKPGVLPSEKVKQFSSIMAKEYSTGGLAKTMKRVQAANNQLFLNGNQSVDAFADISMGFPVILGSYTDASDPNTVVDLLQQELFDGPWPTVTMTEHYAEMSYDKFHLSGQVYGWYELAHNSVYYEGSQTDPYDNGFFGPDSGVGEFLKEALDLSDQEIDFTLYDNDGPDGVPNSGDDDGYVDAVFFVHSGEGGEGGGPYIWSHSWSYSGWWGSAYPTNDIGHNGSVIKVNEYIIQPAVSSSGGLIEIGVFSHEFGHALGLPDLYDTDYSSGGVGDWCLMSGGSWTTPSSPTHMSAWCKEMLGWLVPIVPGENSIAQLIPNVEQNPFAIKLWSHGELNPFISPYSNGQDVGQEYFLIENRQNIGTEQHIPGTGLMIWHVDNSQYHNDDETHRMVDIKAANNAANVSGPGASWPGTSLNRNFDYATAPSSVGWAGVNTEVALLNISDPDTIMHADIEVFELNPQLTLQDLIVEEEVHDHIYAPGEVLEIWVAIGNSGAETNNLTATLSTAGTHVNITVPTVEFDPIDFLETDFAKLPFELELDPALSSQARTFDIALLSDEMTKAVHMEFRLMLGNPDLAVIDDDGVVSGDGDYQAYYTRAIDLTDRIYTVWDIADAGTPTIEWLQKMPTLIWYSGDNQSPLDSNRIELISTFLDEGGNILMSGQDMANDSAMVKDFLAKYFAAELKVSSVKTTRVYGEVSHDIMTGLINIRYSIQRQLPIRQLQMGTIFWRVDHLCSNIPYGETPPVDLQCAQIHFQRSCWVLVSKRWVDLMVKPTLLGQMSSIAC